MRAPTAQTPQQDETGLMRVGGVSNNEEEEDAEAEEAEEEEESDDSKS